MSKLQLTNERQFVANDYGAHSIVLWFQHPEAKGLPLTSTLYPKRRESGYLLEISPQQGCSIGCDFCGCGKFQKSLEPEHVMQQIKILRERAQKIGIQDNEIEQINFTDGGELFLNKHCEAILRTILTEEPNINIKVSSVLPKTSLSKKNIDAFLNLVNEYKTRLRLQVSLYSSSETIRTSSTKVPLFPMGEVNSFAEQYYRLVNQARKITTTFTLTNKSICDPNDIINHISPNYSAIRLHPYRSNGTNNMTISQEKLTELSTLFKSHGYTVITEYYDQHEAEQLEHGGTLTYTYNNDLKISA